MTANKECIYNPFLLDDRIHFPSFREAVGDIFESEKKKKEKKTISKKTKFATSDTVTINVGKRSKSSTTTTSNLLSAPNSNSNLNNIGSPLSSDKINKNESVLMMSNILSPNPINYQWQIYSPNPTDTNACLLAKTPKNFPIIMPSTPNSTQCIYEKRRNVLEEKWCNDYFDGHKPILTPPKQRRNPIKLFDPTNEQIMDQQQLHIDSVGCRKEYNQYNNNNNILINDISAIVPRSNKTSNKTSNNTSNNNTNDNSKTGSKDFLLFGSMHKEGEEGEEGEDDKKNIKIQIQTPNMFEPNNNDNIFNQSIPKSIDQLDDKFSSIKLNKTKKATKCKQIKIKQKEKQQQETENNKKSKNHQTDLLNVKSMTDDEFFSAIPPSKCDQCIQTNPVLIFYHDDIPKIKYNDQLLSNYHLSSNTITSNQIDNNNHSLFIMFNFYSNLKHLQPKHEKLLLDGTHFISSCCCCCCSCFCWFYCTLFIICPYSEVIYDRRAGHLTIYMVEYKYTLHYL